MGKFYVTTPIYYVNAPMHLGHAYTTIACDTLARWHRLRGDDTFFLTGTDEHGGNIEKIAKENNTNPQEWVDRISGGDKTFLADLKISNDDFIRTTEERHRRATEAFWKSVWGTKAPDGKDNIYCGEYESNYCPACEAYYVEGDLVDACCPVHGCPVEDIREQTYFFHLEGYQGVFEDWFAREAGKKPEDRFVVPDSRFNEVYGIVREGLRDVSITRTKISWGFKVPGDEKHVIYVWFDALINYLTAIGYPDGRFRERWPADFHVIGKEIMRFHALLWPAMLKAAGLDLPRKIVAHGWWTVEGDKMSKTKGNVVDPRDYAREFSLDATRYFLLRHIPFGGDGDFSRGQFIERYNSDLANDFGNLAHRTIAMAFKYSGGRIRRPASPSPWEEFILGDEGLKQHGESITAMIKGKTLSFIQAAFERLADSGQAVPQFQGVLADMWRVIGHGNKYLDTRAPWKQAEADREETLGHVIVLLEAASWPLLAFIPEAAGKLRERLGLPKDRRADLPETFVLSAGDPLFPRIDTKGKAKK